MAGPIDAINAARVAAGQPPLSEEEAQNITTQNATQNAKQNYYNQVNNTMVDIPKIDPAKQAYFDTVNSTMTKTGTTGPVPTTIDPAKQAYYNQVNNTMTKTGATGPVPITSYKPTVVQKATDLALQGRDKSTVDAMSSLANRMLSDPSMGRDYDANRQRSLDAYNVNQSRALESLRSKVAGISNSGKTLSDLSSVALQGVLGRNQLENEMDTAKWENMRADIANALASGTTSENVASRHYGDILAGLSQANNMKLAEDAEKRLESSDKLSEASQTYEMLLKTDPTAANEYLNAILRSGTIGGGTAVQVNPMSETEKMKQDVDTQRNQFAYLYKNSPSLVNADGTLTQAGEKLFTDTYSKAILGTTTTGAITTQTGTKAEISEAGFGDYANATKANVYDAISSALKDNGSQVDYGALSSALKGVTQGELDTMILDRYVSLSAPEKEEVAKYIQNEKARRAQLLEYINASTNKDALMEKYGYLFDTTTKAPETKIEDVFTGIKSKIGR